MRNMKKFQITLVVYVCYCCCFNSQNRMFLLRKCLNISLSSLMNSSSKFEQNLFFNVISTKVPKISFLFSALCLVQFTWILYFFKIIIVIILDIDKLNQYTFYEFCIFNYSLSFSRHFLNTWRQMLKFSICNNWRANFLSDTGFDFFSFSSNGLRLSKGDWLEIKDHLKLKFHILIFKELRLKQK